MNYKIESNKKIPKRAWSEINNEGKKFAVRAWKIKVERTKKKA